MLSNHRHEIYQIYWDESTKQSNDQGFKQLNNLSNERPDWSEYWPIRNFLTTSRLQDGVYYGFFSPKFHQKTNLRSQEVYEFLNGSNADVVTFSPFMDQSAFAINLFEQAAANHQSIYPTLKAAINHLFPGVDVDQLVMTSKTSIFCNYFAARKDFWIRWLHECEIIFSLCEKDDHPLAHQLNSAVNHAGGQNPAKVFLIERIASLLLALSERWTIKHFDPLRLPFATSRVAGHRDELITLDALKQTYLAHRNPEILQLFYKTRLNLIQKLSNPTTVPSRTD
jgi:hypothetical protein